MKTTPTLITLLTCAFFTTITKASEIEFEISGINSDQGKIYIQLFKGEKNYQQGSAESASIVKAVKGSTKISFNNISSGEYALRFFHDENNDGELATNLFGIPVEGYGFSNNAKPDFGPVSYQEIKFTVAESASIVTNKTTVIY